MYQNKMDLALKSYEKALSLRQHYPDCYFNLGTLFLKTNRRKLAKESFLKAIAQNSSHFPAFSNLVILLDEQGNFQEAEATAKAAITIFPERSDFYFHLGNIYGKTNQYEIAEVNFKRAIELEPKPEYYANFGVLYHRWKKLELAKEMYLKAPNHRSAQVNLKRLQG